MAAKVGKAPRELERAVSAARLALETAARAFGKGCSGAVVPLDTYRACTAQLLAAARYFTRAEETRDLEVE
jgi:hypothetical protein